MIVYHISYKNNMSAIFGAVKKETTISQFSHSEVYHCFTRYNIDDSNHVKKDTVEFYAFMQRITPESKSEILPYYDERNNLMITADAIIDNREELFMLLSIHEKAANSIADSELILAAYKKWGVNCCNYLIGDFAFAIYDFVKKQLFLCRDHVGKRILYYTLIDGNVFFSTTIQPLLELKCVEPKINKQWIADYLAINTVQHEMVFDSSPIEGIRMLPSAHYLIFTKDKIKCNKYWNPLKAKKIKKCDEKDYIEGFQQVFKEAVHCRMRTHKEVGLMLSGGLDSNAVAYTMTDLFPDRKIYSFSHVPYSEYKDFLPSYLIANETEYIQETLRKLNGLEHEFVSFEDRNSYDTVDDLICTLEQPYKIFHNLYWIDGINQKAAEKNCGVILNGQFGNFSISSGNLETHLLSLLSTGRLIKLVRDLYEYIVIKKIAYKGLLKELTKSIVPGFVNILKLLHRDNWYYHSNCLAKKDFLINYKAKLRLIKWNAGIFQKNYYCIQKVRKIIINSYVFAQTGIADTKMSLKYKVITRDPTMDKRVIEYCFSIPEDVYVHKGMERSLIKNSFAGKIPDKIRLNNKQRGRQSADWFQRIKNTWPQICNEMEGYLQLDCVSEYLAEDEVRKVMNGTITGDLDSSKQKDMDSILRVLILSKYIVGINKLDYSNK